MQMVKYNTHLLLARLNKPKGAKGNPVSVFSNANIGANGFHLAKCDQQLSFSSLKLSMRFREGLKSSMALKQKTDL